MLAFRSLLALLPALSPSLVAQTLPWQIQTETSGSSNGAHLSGHERPASLLSYTSPGNPVHTGGTGDVAVGTLESHVVYDVTLTNTSGMPALVQVQALTGWRPTVHGGTDGHFPCWGSDPASIAPVHVFSPTVPANSTVRYTGDVIPGNIEWQLHPIPTSGSNCLADGLHLYPPGAGLHVFPGFAGSWWIQGPGSGVVTATDNGSSVVHDLTLTTSYELPLIAGSNGCNALVPNSTGAAGALAAFGIAQVATGYVVLNATSLPLNEFGYWILSDSSQSATPMPTGLGTLCLANPVRRWRESLGTTGVAGEKSDPIAFANMPVPGGAITPGSTWSFQLWHRDHDAAGLTTSNTTNAVTVGF